MLPNINVTPVPAKLLSPILESKLYSYFFLEKLTKDSKKPNKRASYDLNSFHLNSPTKEEKKKQKNEFDLREKEMLSSRYKQSFLNEKNEISHKISPLVSSKIVDNYDKKSKKSKVIDEFNQEKVLLTSRESKNINSFLKSSNNFTSFTNSLDFKEKKNILFNSKDHESEKKSKTKTLTSFNIKDIQAIQGNQALIKAQKKKESNKNVTFKKQDESDMKKKSRSQNYNNLEEENVIRKKSSFKPKEDQQIYKETDDDYLRKASTRVTHISKLAKGKLASNESLQPEYSLIEPLQEISPEPQRKNSSLSKLTLPSLKNHKKDSSKSSSSSASSLSSFDFFDGIKKISSYLELLSFFNSDKYCYLNSLFSRKNYNLIEGFGYNTHNGTVRNYNEDRVSIHLHVKKPECVKKSVNWPEIHFLSVIDGHGGSRCADYIKDNLIKSIIRHPQFIDNIETAIKETILTLENEFLKTAVSSDGKNIKDYSGCCLIFFLLVNKEGYIVNLGDSRAVISRSNYKVTEQATRDHKPDCSEELKRIIYYGGTTYM